VRTLSLSVRTAIALAVSAALLGACASSFEASQDRTANIVTGSLPTWAGGEPANIQARSAAPPAYPAVNAPIPPRAAPALTAEEQSKAVADLVAARNRAAAQGKAAYQDEDIAFDDGLALARGKYVGDASPNNN
jgi:hypothetical protein